MGERKQGWPGARGISLRRGVVFGLAALSISLFTHLQALAGPPVTAGAVTAGGGWNASWDNLGAPPGYRGPGPVAVSPEDGTLEIFRLGYANHAFYKTQGSSGAWGAWTDIGGDSDGYHLAAIRAFNGQYGSTHVFIRWSDGSLRHKSFSSQWGTDWVNAGGNFAYGPVLVKEGSYIHAFVLTQDGVLWHRRGLEFPASDSWIVWREPWEAVGNPLGYRIRNLPAAVSWQDGRIDVVVIADNDHAMYHIVYDGNKPVGSQWTPYWDPLGGSFADDAVPSMVAWGPNRLDIVATDRLGRPSHNAWTGSRWSGWESLGGLAFINGRTNQFQMKAASPVVYVEGGSALSVIVTGSDWGLYQRSYRGDINFWGPWRQLAKCTSYVPGAAVYWNLHTELVIDDSNGNTWRIFKGIGASAVAGATPPPCPCGSVGQICCGNASCNGKLLCNVSDRCELPPCAAGQIQDPVTGACSTPTPPPPPPVLPCASGQIRNPVTGGCENVPDTQNTYRNLNIYNCNADLDQFGRHRPIALFLLDLNFATAGYTPLGTFVAQYNEANQCPYDENGNADDPAATIDLVELPNLDNHVYKIILVDPGMPACGGVADPNSGNCVRDSFLIRGNRNGNDFNYVEY